MREIIFGTQNKAKIAQINGALSGTGITVVGVPEGTRAIEAEENGKTAQENAHIKATAYAILLDREVFAMDNALYFEGLPDDEQPALRVRRFKDETRPSDAEMLNFYEDLVLSLGDQEVEGRWEFGICIAKPDGTCKETTIISPRKFIAHASKNVVEGYPLESIQKDPVSGKVISDMSPEEQKDFWLREIGEKLQKFVLESLG